VNFSFTNRIIVVGLVTTALGVGSVAGVGYYAMHWAIAEMAQAHLTSVTSSAYNMLKGAAQASTVSHLKTIVEQNRDIVAYYQQQVDKRLMTLEAAQRGAAAALLSQVVGKSGHVTVITSSGTVVVHPQAALVNTSLAHLDFVKEQLRRREGYLEYPLQGLGDAKPQTQALYMTYFEPWDWIISASSALDEFRYLLNIKDFRAPLLATSVGKGGYSYVMNSQGLLLVHPSLEGQNVYGNRDRDGRLYIQEMCTKKSGTTTYSWKGPKESAGREKLVVYNYFPERDWIIASGAYLDELFAPLERVRHMLAVIALVAVVLAVVLSLLFGHSLGRSFFGLQAAAARVSQGDLRPHRIEASRGLLPPPPEFAAVEQALLSMARSLGQLVRGIAGASRDVDGSVAGVNDGAQAVVAASGRQLGAVTNVASSVGGVATTVQAIHSAIAELNDAAEQGAASTTELSQSLDSLLHEVTQFATFVEQTQRTIRTVAGLSTGIADTTSEVSTAAEQSAQSAAALEHSIRSIDANTKASTSLSQAVKERAQVGQAAVAKSIAGMSSIGVTFAAVDQAVKTLGDRVGAIQAIVQVIEEVSNQTKLLALNASILAVQAGEHGRGFSVVAEEIKGLSDRTRRATSEIAELITAASTEREHTAAVMRTGRQSVQEGSKLAQDAGQSITAILELTEQSHAQTTQVALATRDQVTGNRTIMNAVAQIAAMSRGVLELTAKQQRFANELATGINTVMTSLSVVRRGLEEEARGSKDVAMKIAKISDMSDAIRHESDKQRSASVDIADHVEIIRDSAQAILGRAEKVVGSLSSLSTKVQELTTAVTHFSVDE